MHQEVSAELDSRPATGVNKVERLEALRDFTRKHRSTIGVAASSSVCHFYLPPHTTDPVATAQVREDVLFIHLRSRPNAQRARLETRFFAVGAQLETMDWIPEDRREALRLGIRTCKENTSRENGPCGAMLVAMNLVDPDLDEEGLMNVVPIAFRLDQNALLVQQGMADQWKMSLYHMLNEGIVM
ncbi:hypothetical protein FOMPIDRAFT_93834 [Fomitopsis schrenkii]|uniref:Uncharacterized protein n=1 Tax=Fomitopsis schrenkii TaxID=2126942 RepID=S8DNB2_FOMSC|nr:hypothetical protein FOMPIDRAFT_93834 [Fomitopsis schrenkii]